MDYCKRSLQGELVPLCILFAVILTSSAFSNSAIAACTSPGATTASNVQYGDDAYTEHKDKNLAQLVRCIRLADQ